MAQIYLGASSASAVSQAEKEMLKRCERLPAEFTVVHGVPWVAHRQARSGTVGEADFLILHPRHGILVLEVKGGVVSTKQVKTNGRIETKWFSKSAGGSSYEINDPFQQADRSRHQLRTWLENNQQTRKMLWSAIYPAVVLPDSHLTGDLRPDCPVEIIVDMSGFDAFERRLLDIYTYWNSKYANAKISGDAGVGAIINLLMPTADLTPSLAAAFQREGKQIDALTEEQFSIFKNLRHQNRAVIVGGAGTGKTLLAMEKARRLVDEDKKRVLLICFNSNLAAWIGDKLGAKDESLLEVLTFHQLAERMIRRSKLPTDPRMKDFMDRAADLLQDSLDRLHQKPTAQADLYDAIIIDEGQDFQDEWWIPIPDLLKDRNSGLIYIFFDDNQRLYNQLGNIPFDAPPFALFKNCRNTQSIFTTLKPYLPEDDETECVGPGGRPVQKIALGEDAKPEEELKKILLSLTSEGVSPEDIMLLTPASKARSIWKDDQQISKFVLTWNLQTTMNNAIRISTIHSFKGLESQVIILSEMDKSHEEIADQLTYVGLSRARNHVVVLGLLPHLRLQH